MCSILAKSGGFTSAMIAAGVRALEEYQGAFGPPDLVAAIYSAMAAEGRFKGRGFTPPIRMPRRLVPTSRRLYTKRTELVSVVFTVVKMLESLR
jgi:hypothetical protein